MDDDDWTALHTECCWIVGGIGGLVGGFGGFLMGGIGGIIIFGMIASVIGALIGVGVATLILSLREIGIVALGIAALFCLLFAVTKSWGVGL